MSDARFANQPRLKIAITGSTGLVGSALVRFLISRGHQVVRLVRDIRKRDTNDCTTSVLWQPDQGKLNPVSLDGVDGVINLAGENIAKGRWTASKKQRILDCRVKSAALLAETLPKLRVQPKVFFSASAIGYYPSDQSDRIWTESDSPGKSFLSQLCIAWEDAAQAAHQSGIRTVLGRFGMVLSRHGGALAAQLPVFKWCLGGRLGPGNQYVSWIAIDDLVRAIEHCLMDPDLNGPVNCTTPQPVTNSEFTKTLGRVLHRPTMLPAPAPVLRLALGEMADELLLSSHRVYPEKLQRAEFCFGHPDLASALHHVLGVDSNGLEESKT